MSQSATTKEQRFLMTMYAIGNERGDVYAPIERGEIGEACGFLPKGVDTITQQLLQTNFVVKAGERRISLTRHGENLALALLT